MFYIDLTALAILAGILIYAVVAGRFRPLRDAPRDVLICAAHSDDCVIMGSEYAYGAIHSGLAVKILYLTCSGTNPTSELSRTRQAEAYAAWSAVGVPKENLTFVNLSQSPVRGPHTYSPQEIEEARKILRTSILSLPKEAALIIPAPGELHVDHRTIRELSLQELADADRQDLLVYETPEYNELLSFVHCPKRTIWTILQHVPLLSRIIGPYRGSASFASGTQGFVFNDTPLRLAKKKELLMHFRSQDGVMLVKLFGHKSPYRKVTVSGHVRESESALPFFAFGHNCDLSTLAAGFVALFVAFCVAHATARGLTTALSPYLSEGLAALGGVIACVVVIRRSSRTGGIETALFACAAALGLIIGAT